jgi:hypothetical protein
MFTRKTWLKTKCFTGGSFVIIGTARDRKTKAPLALLARANEKRRCDLLMATSSDKGGSSPMNRTQNAIVPGTFADRR